MEFETNDMTTLPKFWLDFHRTLTDKSKELAWISVGMKLKTQLREEGMLRFLETVQQEFDLKEKRIKK